MKSKGRIERITAVVTAVALCVAAAWTTGFIYTKATPALVEVFVSAEGTDKANGTKENPFKTIEQARDYLRTQELDSAHRAVVYLREGTYYVDAANPTVKLEEQDSFVTYSAYEKEIVTISGTVPLSAEKFKKLSDVEGEQYVSKERLQPAVRENILVYDLGADNIATGTIHKNGFNWPKKPFAPELSVNGELQTLAQYPNEGAAALTMSSILAGKTKDGKNEDADAKAAGANEGERPRNYIFDKTDMPKTYEEMLLMKGPVFYVRNGLEKRIEKWAPPTVENEPQNAQEEPNPLANPVLYETDGWLSGYFENNYANDMARIYSVDMEKQTIHCKYPSLQGVQDKRIQLRATNLLCELDAPGEYYIDRYQGNDVLYYYPKKENLAQQNISLTSSGESFFSLKGAKEVVIKGIHFDGGTGDGMTLYDCEGCSIEQCEFSNISLDAVKIGENNLKITMDPSYDTAGGGHHNVVRNCVIHDMGCGGVYLAGGDEQTLERGDNIVEHCEFYNISRLQNYTPAVYLEGCGNTARYNYMHDAPHMVMQIMGNDMLITHNFIENACLNSADSAPIYSGRCFNWLGNEISYNYIKNVSSGSYAIYMDDGMSGMIIKGNVFENINSSAIFSNCGFGHQITDNVMINVKNTVLYKAFSGSRPVPNEKVLSYRYGSAFVEGDGTNGTNTKENITVWLNRYADLYPYLKQMYYPNETDSLWLYSEESVFVPANQILNHTLTIKNDAKANASAVEEWQTALFNTANKYYASYDEAGFDSATGKFSMTGALSQDEKYGKNWIAAWNESFTLEGIGVVEEGVQPSSSQPASAKPIPSQPASLQPIPSQSVSAHPKPSSTASSQVIPGDVDRNKKVELKDAQIVLRAALHLLFLDEDIKELADMDKDHLITMRDARIVLRKALHLIE